MKATVEAIRQSWSQERKEQMEYWSNLDQKAGIFPCRSFNLGKQTASLPHLDQKNLAQGWCSITPLGNFNPDLGGHLVLWDFKLVIRFSAGSTVLIPSALLTHSNIPVHLNETRYSIVQYAAGRLFRWVQNGFRFNKDRLAHASKQEVEIYKTDEKLHWERAVDMYTKLDEL